MKACCKLIIPFLFAILMFGCQTASNINQTPIMEKPEPVAEEPRISKALETQKTVRLQIKNAPSDVRAMGFEIWFDPDVLVFEKYDRNDLMSRGFAIFGSNVVRPGKLRMGGIQSGKTPISQGVSGEMLTLHFKVIGSGEPNFSIMKKVDDLETWATRVSSCKEGDDFAGLALCE